MTPKEKALELIQKYNLVVLDTALGGSNQRVKQCALIAVDEILNELDELLELPEQQQDSVYGSWLYYKEVKHEIENL